VVRLWRSLPRKVRAKIVRAAATVGVVFLVVTVAINGAVRWVGGGHLALLDPRWLDDKAWALMLYARHRPACALFGEADVRDEVMRAGKKHGVDPHLLMAMIHTESGLIPHRISRRGAMGPAQLMPGTAKELGVSDPFAPAQAIDGGARYLKAQLDRFRNVRFAVAAYNAGPGNVRGAVPQNGETEVYVARVMDSYRAFRARPKKR
jgi:soluble lytic murein transglycosylase-like protein